jgi:hypothetical protein
MTERGEQYEAYFQAIQNKVCSLCLDQRNDGACGLTERVCAIERHLPSLVDAIMAVQSSRMDDYVAAITAHVCTHCADQDAEGHCALRDQADCALSSYLSLVVDAVEDVRGPLTPVH